MSKQDSRIQVLESIAAAWNRAGINYAVAHGLEEYPDRIGRDLDVFVEASHAAEAIEIARQCLRQCGCAIAQPPPLWGQRLVAFKHEGWRDAIEIHTISKLSWRNVVFVTRPNPSDQKGPFKVDPWISFVKSILTPLLAGDIDRFVRKPQHLSVMESQQERLMSLLQPLCGYLLAHSLCRTLLEKDLNHIRLIIPRLRRSFAFRALLKAPLSSLRAGSHTIWRRVGQLFATCAPVIALVGPDGVGKSTVLASIIDSDPSIFTKTVARHWRPGILPNLGALAGTIPTKPVGDLCTAPRREAGKLCWLRLCYYFLDFILGHFLRDRIDSSRQRLVLYDRCALDMMVDPVRYGLSSPRASRLICRLIPKPDMIVLLYDNPEHIHSRKPELSTEETGRQLKEWLRLAEQGDVDAIILVDAPPEEIAHRVKSLLIDAFVRKNRGSISSADNSPKWLKSILTRDTQNPVTVGSGANSSNDGHNGQATHVFGVLSPPGGRGYLIPLESRRMSIQALDLYNAQACRARLAKRLLTIGLGLGIAQPLIRKVHMGIPEAGLNGKAANRHLLEQLKQMLGRKDLRFAISLGTPGPHRKPVLQALTSDGTIIGYVKVGWNTITNSLVQNEAEVLRCLGNGSFSSLVAPTVLYAGWWEECFFCLQSPPGDKVKVAPGTLTPRYLAVQKELAAVQTRRVSLRESTFWAGLSQRIERVQDTYYRHILQHGSSTAEAWLGDGPLPFHFSHGDYAPWNTRLLNGRLLLFDWEYSAPEAPPGYDLFHFTVQTARLLNKRSPGQTCQLIERRKIPGQWIAEHLESLGMNGLEVKPLLLLYVLERLAFYASDRNADPQTLQHFANMVNLVTLEEK